MQFTRRVWDPLDSLFGLNWYMPRSTKKWMVDSLNGGGLVMKLRWYGVMLQWLFVVTLEGNKNLKFVQINMFLLITFMNLLQFLPSKWTTTQLYKSV